MRPQRLFRREKKTMNRVLLRNIRTPRFSDKVTVCGVRDRARDKMAQGYAHVLQTRRARACRMARSCVWNLSLSLALSLSLSLSLCGLRFRPRSDLSDEEIIHPPVSDKGLPIMLAWSPFAENARRDDSQRECVHTTSSDKPPQQLTSRRSCSAGLCGPCVAVATRRSLPSARC